MNENLVSEPQVLPSGRHAIDLRTLPINDPLLMPAAATCIYIYIYTCTCIYISTFWRIYISPPRHWLDGDVYRFCTCHFVIVLSANPHPLKASWGKSIPANHDPIALHGCSICQAQDEWAQNRSFANKVNAPNMIFICNQAASLTANCPVLLVEYQAKLVRPERRLSRHIGNYEVWLTLPP